MSINTTNWPYVYLLSTNVQQIVNKYTYCRSIQQIVHMYTYCRSMYNKLSICMYYTQLHFDTISVTNCPYVHLLCSICTLKLICTHSVQYNKLSICTLNVDQYHKLSICTLNVVQYNKLSICTLFHM